MIDILVIDVVELRSGRKKKPAKAIRSAKITEPDAMKTDERPYKPKVIQGGKLAWDFAGDNINVRD